MYENYNDISYAESPFGTLNQYMTKTFGWMFAGLMVTFAVAIGAVTSGLVYAFISSGVFFITCIAELILVGVLSARVTSLQPSTATGIFFAYAALNQNVCDELIMIDLNEKRAEGETMDLNHGLAFSHSSMKIRCGGYGECADADIVVICAGANQKLSLIHI